MRTGPAVAALSHHPPGASANGARPHSWFLPVCQLHRAERNRRIRQRDGERHPAALYSPREARRMQHAEVDRMRSDIVLAGDVEPPLGVGNDFLMDVAVGTPDVHVRAGVVRDQPGVLTAPRAGEATLGRAHARRVARAKHSDRNGEESGGLGEHTHECTPRALPASHLCAASCEWIQQLPGALGVLRSDPYPWRSGDEIVPAEETPHAKEILQRFPFRNVANAGVVQRGLGQRQQRRIARLEHRNQVARVHNERLHQGAAACTVILNGGLTAPKLVAVMSVWPVWSPVTRPWFVTLATSGRDDWKVKLSGSIRPW